MATLDPNAEKTVSGYIDTVASPLKEICVRLRQIIREASPELREDWKWGPNYNANGMVCGFSGFRKHAKLTFFRGGEMSDRYGLFNHCLENVGNRSIKYTSVEQIDAPKLAEYVREAVALNLSGAPAIKKDTREIVVPGALEKLLEASVVARGYFEAMSAYKKKEFIEQVETAKRPETLEKRLVKIAALLEEGRGWNDKYREKT